MGSPWTVREAAIEYPWGVHGHSAGRLIEELQTATALMPITQQSNIGAGEAATQRPNKMLTFQRVSMRKSGKGETSSDLPSRSAVNVSLCRVRVAAASSAATLSTTSHAHSSRIGTFADLAYVV